MKANFVFDQRLSEKHLDPDCFVAPRWASFGNFRRRLQLERHHLRDVQRPRPISGQRLDYLSSENENRFPAGYTATLSRFLIFQTVKHLLSSFLTSYDFKKLPLSIYLNTSVEKLLFLLNLILLMQMTFFIGGGVLCAYVICLSFARVMMRNKTDWVFSRLHQVCCQEWTGTGSDRATEHQRVHLGLRQAEDVPIRGAARVAVEIEWNGRCGVVAGSRNVNIHWIISRLDGGAVATRAKLERD